MLCLCAALFCASLAQADLTQAEKDEFAQLMKKVKVINDPVENRTTFALPQRMNDGYFDVQLKKRDGYDKLILYIGCVFGYSNGHITPSGLRYSVLSGYVINVDGEIYRAGIPFERLSTNAGDGSLTQYIGISLGDNPEMYDLVKKIVKSEKTVVRLKGDRGSADSTVSLKKKQAVAALLRIYELEKKQKDTAEK